MDHRFKKSLEKYAKNAILVAKKYFDTKNEIQFDHISYQTLSLADYHKALQELKGDIELIDEISHAGRLLGIALFKVPFSSEGILIDKIEISEPKPKRIVTQRIFDHVSFSTGGNFERAVEKLKKQGVKISEVKQIGTTKFIKFKESDIEIELRNNRIAGDKIQQKAGVEQQKEGITHKDVYEDKIKFLKKQLEEEKEKHLRALADYRNLEKRATDEKKNLSIITESILLSKLIDLLDDFDRTIENLKIEEKDQVGIRLVRDKMQKIIDASGLEEIKCLIGDKLNPEIHEAVGIVVVAKDEENNTVKQIVQKGYKLSKMPVIVKHVKVIVGKKGT
jgi:molecular chaperone GrpE